MAARHGLIILPDIRAVRGAFLWLPCEQRGKATLRKSKTASSSVTVQENRCSESCNCLYEQRYTERGVSGRLVKRRSISCQVPDAIGSALLD